MDAINYYLSKYPINKRTTGGAETTKVGQSCLKDGPHESELHKIPTEQSSLLIPSTLEEVVSYTQITLFYKCLPPLLIGTLFIFVSPILIENIS